MKKLCKLRRHTNACDSSNSPELMYYIPWQEVNVVIIQVYSGILNALPSELIQLRIFNPRNTLNKQKQT